MKLATLGTLVIAVLLIAFLTALPDGEVFGQRAAGPRAVVPEGELIALSTIVGGRYEQLTVLDPRAKVLAVYHIDLETGKPELMSVRAISQDLQLTAFNAQRPLPQEIRSMLEHSR